MTKERENTIQQMHLDLTLHLDYEESKVAKEPLAKRVLYRQLLHDQLDKRIQTTVTEIDRSLAAKDQHTYINYTDVKQLYKARLGEGKGYWTTWEYILDKTIRKPNQVVISAESLYLIAVDVMKYKLCLKPDYFHVLRILDDILGLLEFGIEGFFEDMMESLESELYSQNKAQPT